MGLGLQKKFTFLITLLLFILTILLIIINITFQQKSVKQRMDEKAMAVGSLLKLSATNSLSFLRMGQLRLLLADVLNQKDAIYAYAFDEEGRILSDGTEENQHRDEILKDIISQRAISSDVQLIQYIQNILDITEPIYLGDKKIGGVRIGFSLDQVKADIAFIQRRNLILCLVVILIGAIFAYILTRRITIPISRLLAATESVAKGNFSSKIRVKVKSRDEIGQLAHSFNKMAEDLSVAMKKEKELAVQATLAAEMEKKKSKELQKAQKDLEKRADELTRSNKELEEFAYIASHDLQEPLRKVKTFGDRLTQKYGEALGDQGQDYLKRMGSATSRMQTLINDLLTYSRVTSKAQPFTAVNLNSIVREVLSDLEIKIKEANAQIHVDNLLAIEADPVQMRQLFQNLIGNALKFSKPGVSPVVEIRSALKSSQGKDADEESLMNECVRVIKVVDNGIGFEEKYKEQIFHVFQRLHGRNEYAGTGIGLAVCRKLVTRHGGSIEAKSTPGKGSTFMITLPIIQPKEEKKGEA